MGTRLRVIVDLGEGDWLQGQAAVRYLRSKIFTSSIGPSETQEQWLMRVFKTYDELYGTISRVPIMWLFREPRRIKLAKSRYMSVCRALGIGGICERAGNPRPTWGQRLRRAQSAAREDALNLSLNAYIQANASRPYPPSPAQQQTALGQQAAPQVGRTYQSYQYARIPSSTSPLTYQWGTAASNITTVTWDRTASPEQGPEREEDPNEQF